jgi:flagellar motor switch protein FliN
MAQAEEAGFPAIARWLADEFAGGLASALEAMTGARPGTSCCPLQSAQPQTQGEWLWWAEPLDAAPEACIWLGAPEPVWMALGGETLRAAGVDDAEPADKKSTFLELLSQGLAAPVLEMGARLSREVNRSGGREAGTAPDSTAVGFEITLSTGQVLEIRFSPALLNAFAAKAVVAAEPEPVLETRPPSRTLDLLMEVELPVSVSFGRAQLPLREVLKLTTGAIVELNRAVSEPVEVIVNNCVIARGEVVVVEGNYGVRIHQIVSRQERLRSLR